jgi:hypothetical protein
MKFLLRRNFLFSIVVLFSFSAAQSQSQYSNLEKYWKYRERLKDKFMVIDENVEEMGVNLPGNIYLTNSFGTTFKFGDNNPRSALYISLLSTELWILKNNEQDYSETLKELYYALLAIERLDLYSEAYERLVDENNWTTIDQVDFSQFDILDLNSNDINGYYIRDDISEEFWNQYSNQFDANDFTSVFENETFFLEGISQDNIFNVLQSLSLLESLVGIESVEDISVSFNTNHIPAYLTGRNIKNGDFIDFQQWAIDLTLRFTSYMQHTVALTDSTVCDWFKSHFETQWYITDSRGELVPEGSGKYELGFWFHWGVISSAVEITGLSENEVRDANGDFPTLSAYQNSFDDGSFPVFGSYFDQNLIWIKEPEQKTRCLGTFGDILGNISTLDSLRYLRDHNIAPLEHLPLVYMIVHRDKYDVESLFTYGSQDFLDEMEIYTNLLDQAPECGPHNDITKYDYNYEWSGSTRNKPWTRDSTGNGDVCYYSGMDYMLLHNLLYIAFLQEDLIDKVYDSFFYNQTYNLYGSNVIIECPVVDSDVTVTARNSVVLNPGFEIIGSTFKVIMDPPDYNIHNYKELSVIPCN